MCRLERPQRTEETEGRRRATHKGVPEHTHTHTHAQGPGLMGEQATAACPPLLTGFLNLGTLRSEVVSRDPLKKTQTYVNFQDTAHRNVCFEGGV